MSLGVGKAGTYVPPNRKVGFTGKSEAGPEGGSNPMSMGEDHTKIRVTNISEDTTEGDLRELFSSFGRINRWGLQREVGQGVPYPRCMPFVVALRDHAVLEAGSVVFFPRGSECRNVSFCFVCPKKRSCIPSTMS